MQWLYKCLTENNFQDKEGYQLVSIRKEDIENIRQWRNAQMDVLRQKSFIAEKEQQTYFSEIIEPTFVQLQPKQILFSYLYNQICIGYGGLTNVDWENRRAEVSFLVNPERVQEEELYACDYSHFLALLSFITFENLGFHRLYTETFAFRKTHMRILEEFGFKLEGSLREHVNKHNRWYDSIMHGLLAKEFKNAQ